MDEQQPGNYYTKDAQLVVSWQCMHLIDNKFI